MILFYGDEERKVYAIELADQQELSTLGKLSWVFSWAKLIDQKNIKGFFVGPRKEMVTPWSTNAVEIARNMGIKGLTRMEEFIAVDSMKAKHDPMLQALYENLTQHTFTTEHTPNPVLFIDNIAEYNQKEGLALSNEEISYLEDLSQKIGRKLTDSEVFGFSQVNSEHCRHKIFNGVFIIDGQEKPLSLFELIKKTSLQNPNKIISAYKDNCAFLRGPIIEQFSPEFPEISEFFRITDIETVLSLKAETHNFPTTVEPFNGAATGTGGEIRDRLAGGKGGVPLIGTAVYMTAYPRLEKGRTWETANKARKWKYHTPEEILIKASNGASDFGNKFGQPLICGSVLTFERIESNKKYGYDKVIMLAGGIGYAKLQDSMKDIPEKGDLIVLLGGDNYRIGMGGGSVSSVATGEYTNAIELNAVQRANPEMQKRVANVIKSLTELKRNPVVSIHDHGAGGHLNCFSELVEAIGGRVDISKLPVGDPTLSAREIIGNESQERMGLVVKERDIEIIRKIANRERCPMYVVGEITGDHRLVFEDSKNNCTPINLDLGDFFGNPPKTIINDTTIQEQLFPLTYSEQKLQEYLENVLHLEAVACKDWLTNKVDRSVTGKVAKQQTAGSLQLPLNNMGVAALDFQGIKGMATSLGHAPVSGLIDSAKASILSIAEALTNIVWAPIDGGLKGISLSANWMWPSKNKGEDARLYQAVEAASNFAIQLGINIPTGKDSLSMTQKYDNGQVVYSPGTVIISASAEVTDIRKVVSPVLKYDNQTVIVYIDFAKDAFHLGGSSFAQSLNEIGNECPTVSDATYFANTFETLQTLISNEKIISGHDISSGGLITTLLEMTFAELELGMEINLDSIPESDIIRILFSEKPGVVIQIKDEKSIFELLNEKQVHYHIIGHPIEENRLQIKKNDAIYNLDINSFRDIWFKSSYLLDRKQCGAGFAKERFDNYKKQPLDFIFNTKFNGKATDYGINLKRRESTGIKAAIIREKGVNGDREMAYSLYCAGFDVKDVHITDLINGRETLNDIKFVVFVGGFSNSDVLGSAKGWAGSFLFNKLAKKALDDFYARPDTMSLGVCNGCQLMVELGLIYPEHEEQPKMLTNQSNKFESAFINLNIEKSNSIMLKSLQGSRLGIWIAHKEGRFKLPQKETTYQIAAKYTYKEYPANPNGSDFNTAAISSEDGRHLAMMPHLERSIFPWQWAKYPDNRKNDEVTPWIEAFVNARKWIEKNSNK